MRRLFLICAATCVLAACAPPPAAPPPRASSGAGDESELVRLADEAFARGEIDTARRRYARVLAADPGSRRARAGLARVDLALGNPEAARARYREALDRSPDSVPALVGLAEVERAGGDEARAADLLAQALAIDPSRADAHAALAAITGPAPTAPLASPGKIVQRAEDHPYDPRALLEAGHALARAGEAQTAIAVLEKAVWLADLDPPSADAALRLLARLDPDWRERQVVRVHVYADEVVRGWPGWRFQIRTLWLNASTALDGILGTRFVLGSIGACRAGEAPVALEAIQLACLSSAGRHPRRGLVAVFTGRPIPKRPGEWKRGLAEFAGRRMIARVEPEKQQSRVLAHEILHIYGAVHVVDDVESLMNPAGGTTRLDGPNARIVRALRERRFDAGGFDRNVLPWIDLGETIEAYEGALALNLHFRKLGLEDAVDAAAFSRFDARRQAKDAQSLDPHLADIARTLAALKVADGRTAEAIALLEAAARFYGSSTRRGRETAALADRLRERLRREVGAPGG